ncbi:MAG: hypothetical protein AAFO94_17475, partial [Bacteroidota bacterium]
DVFRIEVIDSKVYYSHNGNLFYESANTPTLPLIVDISMQDVGGSISNAVVSNPTDGTFTVNNPDGIGISNYQWQLNSGNVGSNAFLFVVL